MMLTSLSKTSINNICFAFLSHLRDSALLFLGLTKKKRHSWLHVCLHVPRTIYHTVKFPNITSWRIHLKSFLHLCSRMAYNNTFTFQFRYSWQRSNNVKQRKWCFQSVRPSSKQDINTILIPYSFIKKDLRVYLVSREVRCIITKASLRDVRVEIAPEAS